MNEPSGKWSILVETAKLAVLVSALDAESTHVLPFYDRTEAEANAVALHTALEYHALGYGLSPEAESVSTPPLHRTCDLIGKAFGFTSWLELIRMLAPKDGRPPYFDSDDSEAIFHAELVDYFLPFFSHENKEERIRASLYMAAFGCSPAVRLQAYDNMIRMPWETVDEQLRIGTLRSGYHRATRYRQCRTPEDAEWFQWEYDAMVAEALGEPSLRRPKRRR